MKNWRSSGVIDVFAALNQLFRKNITGYFQERGMTPEEARTTYEILKALSDQYGASLDELHIIYAVVYTQGRTVEETFRRLWELVPFRRPSGASNHLTVEEFTAFLKSLIHD